MLTGQSDNGQVTLDIEVARYWIEQLHGDSRGLMHVCSTGDWAGRVCKTVDEALKYVARRDRQGAQGIYLRATTIHRVPAFDQRGSEEDSACLPALWADIDIAGAGHKTPKPLPTTEHDARDIIGQSGLPEPTFWVHSGGGLYPWWIMDTPFCIEKEEDLQKARQLSDGWHEVLAFTAKEMSFHYGTETADLARVLRIPGTVNRKVPGEPRLCRVLDDGSGRLYAFEELFDAMSAQRLWIPLPQLPMIPAVPYTGEARPGDDYNKRVTWDEILAPEGWQRHHERDRVVYWTRPGKELRDGWSATTGRDAEHDRLYVFSSSTVFPTDRAIDKFAAHAYLHHGGNLSAAAADLKSMGFGEAGSAPVQDVEAIGSVFHETQSALTPTTPPDPGKYLTDKGGVLVAALAVQVAAMGPLAVDLDGTPWSYQDGLWHPDKFVVRNRVVQLLGDKYRRGHATNAEDVMDCYAPRINCEPVERFINFRNGLLDWRAGKLIPHTPEVLSTVQLSVEWDEQARCPKFDQFLTEVVDADVIDTAWELIGYLMMSGNPFQKAVMLSGTGRNGKGTLLHVVTALLGKENVASVTLQDLNRDRFSGSDLYGKIANIAGDIDGTYVESTAMFKSITGRDTVRVQRKYRDPFQFIPWAVPVFSANAIPPSADATVGYLSRWLVVNFPNNFEGRERVRLEDELCETELPGIAARGAQALRVLMNRGGFAMTDSNLAAKEQFAREVDQVRMWVHEECEVTGDLNVWEKGKVLYEGYRFWAREAGHRPVGRNAFYARLRGIKGVEDYRRENEKGLFTGIKHTGTKPPSLYGLVEPDY